MAKKHDVYMPVIIGDWLKGTRGMKASVRGVYLSLLLYQWDNGFIPESMEELTLIDPEVGSVWVFISQKFPKIEPGKLQNEKLEEVRNYFSKQKANAKKGGRPKGTTKSKYITQEQFDWEEMILFFNNSCICCGYEFEETERPTKDHIVPKIIGGIDHITNYQPLCRQCNSSKHSSHSTDYRLNFIDKIPEELRNKWFKSNSELTQIKPKGNLHNGIGIGIEFKEEEGVVGETFEPVPESLIGEMKTAWKISNPGTFIDETENAILLELSTKIKKWMALPGQVTDHENKVVILRRWGEVVRHCSQDPHLVKYSISQVNKHFSSVTQSFKSNQNGSKSRKGAADQRPVIDESPTSSGVL